MNEDETKDKEDWKNQGSAGAPTKKEKETKRTNESTTSDDEEEDRRDHLKLKAKSKPKGFSMGNALLIFNLFTILYTRWRPRFKIRLIASEASYV